MKTGCKEGEMADYTSTTTTEPVSLLPKNEEMLQEINNAILTVLKGGQSYKIGSRQLTRADLKELYAMRKEIEAGINAEAAGNTGFLDDTYVAVFPWDR